MLVLIGIVTVCPSLQPYQVMKAPCVKVVAYYLCVRISLNFLPFDYTVHLFNADYFFKNSLLFELYAYAGLICNRQNKLEITLII